jgi:peptidoglycan hydrolase-like protein with peptidoglycan-binding domain
MLVRVRLLAGALAIVMAGVAPAAEAAGRARVAGIQVALRSAGAYGATIDGIAGPLTRSATRRFQRRRGLAPDGVIGPRTLRALGRRGRPPLGRRTLHAGQVGLDVASLQFRLAWRGFPSGPLDGGFGARTDAAVRRFQRWAHLGADGIVGPATLRALRRPIRRSPLRFAWPARARLGDGFGPRGNRFHPGLDLPLPTGARVGAAGYGTVRFAGWDPGGYGNLVVIGHRLGVTTWYAHLSRISVGPGRFVTAGTRIGAVGSTGLATGPHLHFEMRLRGAAIDPLSGLP